MRMRLPGAELRDPRPRGPAAALRPVSDGLPSASGGRPRRANRPHLPQHALRDAASARSHCPAPRDHARHHRRPGERRRFLPAALARDGPHRARLLRASAARSAADPVADPKPAAGFRRLQAGSADAIRCHAAAAALRPPCCARTQAKNSAPARGPAQGAQDVRLQRAAGPRGRCLLPGPGGARADLPCHRAVASAGRGAARAGMDNLVLFSAPRRDGLRWIDVGDPQLRKVDKLQTSNR